MVCFLPHDDVDTLLSNADTLRSKIKELEAGLKMSEGRFSAQKAESEISEARFAAMKAESEATISYLQHSTTVRGFLADELCSTEREGEQRVKELRIHISDLKLQLSDMVANQV